MGINLGLVRANIDKDNRLLDYPESCVKEFNWDTLRHTGDRELVRFLYETGNNKQISYPHYPPDVWFKPRDFEAAYLWVDQITPEGNRHRLYQLLDILRDNPDVYIAVW